MIKTTIQLPLIEGIMLKLRESSLSLNAYSMFLDDDLENNQKHLYEISQDLDQIYCYIKDITGITPRR